MPALNEAFIALRYDPPSEDRRRRMLECWPPALSCLLAGGLEAALRAVAADLLHVLRRLGLDPTALAATGWALAAFLYLLWRIERAQRRGRPVAAPPADPHPDRAGPQDGGDPAGR